MLSIKSIPGMFHRRNKSRKQKTLQSAPLIESQPGGIRLLWIAIGLLVMTALPHINHVRFEVIALFLAFAGYRCLAARYRFLPRNRWIIYLFALIGFSVAAWHYGPPVGRDPGVAFLLVMMGLKCIEISSRRDVGIVVLLGFFTIITQFLYADGISWTLPLMALAAALTWLLSQMEHAEPRLYMKSDLKLVGKMLLQALPIVVILFYLFPRLSGSFFLFQNDGSNGQTGLSESLKMGTISNLVESTETAFVASFFDQPAPIPRNRYWRGSNFWVTDGREWQRGGHGVHLLRKQPEQAPVHQFSYEIELQPNNQNWLFSLDYPSKAPDNGWLQGDYQLLSKQPIKQTMRYQLDAVQPVSVPDLSEAERELALSLGDTIITPRLQTLIDSFTAGSRNPVDVANRVLAHFNQQEFVYTLSPPLLASQAPVDEFMFDSRHGFCGHYASSFATIMRQAGIPARVVVGYLGGEYNPRSNQITVRQSEAHAWTEIWQQGQGWIRVDPTAAIAPERVESSIDLNSSRDGNGLVLFNSSDLRGLSRLFVELGWFKDAIKAKWNRWFINFDKSRQEELLKSMGLDKLDLRLVSMLAFLLAMVLLTIISFALFRRDKTPIDVTTKTWLSYCHKLQHLGIRRMPNEGPRDFQQRARQHLPHLAAQIDQITDQLVALRYGEVDPSNVDESQLDRLRQLIRQLKPRSRQTAS